MKLHMTFDTDLHYGLMFRSLDDADAFARVHGGMIAVRPDACRWFEATWFPVGVTIAEITRCLPSGYWWVGPDGTQWPHRLTV